MNKRGLPILSLASAAAALLWVATATHAVYGPNPGVNYNVPNWVNSPLPTVVGGVPTPGTGIRKFVDSLPGLGPGGANTRGQYIPVATPFATPPPGVPNDGDYYEIGLNDYYQQMHQDLPLTKLRGYKDLNPSLNPLYSGDNTNHYLGPVIVAQRNRPVRIKFINNLATGTAGNLFLPVDTTLMGAGLGPDFVNNFKENRATLHLHGGLPPWISDGTPHQWTVPAGETTPWPKGVSTRDVPDMPPSGPGAMTWYWPNQQSGRLMFYHDHAYGITRLNVYAGEAAGYLIHDPVEDQMITDGVIPNNGGGLYTWGIPLVIQDKTFVPDSATVAANDPLWDTAKWGGLGSLWFPHVYMPNQDPYSSDGTTPFGRWDYGPWFWPPWPVIDPIVPTISCVPEAFMDTPIVNGQAYPYLNVARTAYRFRILNACNDRFLNLQLYFADPTNATEVAMVESCLDTNFPPYWPTDGRAGGVPNPTNVGPNMIQIGTEGGILPGPVVLTNMPINYEYNRRSIVVLNINQPCLLLGPAERADVIVDFSGCTNGATLILYNDAPAPVPAFDSRIDYYTGDPDQTAGGGAPTTIPGYGPNTRTVMQFRVTGATAAPTFDYATLQTRLPLAFAASQPPVIVPEMAYGAPTNYYAKIQDTSITFTNMGSTTTTNYEFQPKAIQELFDPIYGRMNATLGVELPFTSALIQTTIPYFYIDPPTEIIAENQVQLWKITHNGVDTHAIHFHLVNVQVINRVGWDGQIRPPDDNELGWKETVRMNPLEDIVVAMKAVAPTNLPFAVTDSVRLLDVTSPAGSTAGFTGVDPNNNPVTVTNELTNFGWEYVWHCHLLGHEENDMMRPLIMVKGATLPAAPTALAGVVNGPALSVALSWTDNAVNENGFRLERSLSPSYTALTTFFIGPNGTTGATVNYNDITALPGRTYYYRLFAYNALGDSAPAATTVVTTPPLPTAPRNLVALQTPGAVTVTVNWNTPLPANQTGYVLQRATNIGFTAGVIGFTLAGNTTSLVDNSVATGTPYFYRILAFNQAGNGPYSSISTVTVVAPTVPAAPSNLVLQSKGSNYAIIRWTDNSNNEQGFRIERSPATGPVTWTLVGQTTVNSSAFRDNGLGRRTTYLYRVYAYNAYGVSGYSNTLTATTR